MKKALLLISVLFAAGCSDRQDENDRNKNISEDLWEISAKASGDVQHKYQLMENFPIEGGPAITEEPEHAAVSKIEYSEKGVHYVYQPKAGFTGTDEVEITNNISNGAEIVGQTILQLKIEVNE